jgi:hypothetical protein
MTLTTGRIVHCIVRHVNGASIELALGWDIGNARRDFLPQRLAVAVVREESRRLPNRWEVVYILGNGRVRTYFALRVQALINKFSEERQRT